MKMTANPYAHRTMAGLSIGSICAKKGWDEGYSQALLDVAQYMLDNGHSQVAVHLLETEASRRT